MRTKSRLYSMAVAVVACALLAVTPAAAAAKGSGKRPLRIVATETQFQFLDLGTAGPSLGDELVFSERLSIRGREVGTSGVVCTATQLTPPYDVTWYHCVGTLRLQRGQITLQGLIEVQGENDQGPFVVAITGGTGAYRSAGGTAVIRAVSDTQSVYKLYLDLPKKKKSQPKSKR